MNESLKETGDEDDEVLRAEVLRLKRLGMNALDIHFELNTFPFEATRILHQAYLDSEELEFRDVSEFEGLFEIAMERARWGNESPNVEPRAKVVMDVSDPKLLWDPGRVLWEFQHHARRQGWPVKGVKAVLVASLHAMARRVQKDVLPNLPPRRKGDPMTERHIALTNKASEAVFETVAKYVERMP